MGRRKLYGAPTSASSPPCQWVKRRILIAISRTRPLMPKT